MAGRGHLLEDSGLVGCVQADREEDRLGAVGGERRQHHLGVLRPGPVVEGQHDLALAQKVVALEMLEAEARAAGGVDLHGAGNAERVGIAGARHRGGRRSARPAAGRLELGAPFGAAGACAIMTGAAGAELRGATAGAGEAATGAAGAAATGAVAAGAEVSADLAARAAVGASVGSVRSLMTTAGPGGGAGTAATGAGAEVLCARTAPTTAIQTSTASAHAAATRRMAKSPNPRPIRCPDATHTPGTPTQS